MLHISNRRTVLSLSTLAALALAWAAIAGPINPPAGPIVSTAKPLSEVEPRTAINLTNTPGDANSVFRISQPGSYYLTGNITGVAAKHGVEIEASGVTLDLNGFDLAGVPGSLDGVAVTLPNAVNISIRNGSVRSWGASGINLTDASTSATNVSDIVASQNGLAGIRMGFGGTITRCTAYNNTASGIAGAAGTVISDCAAYVNLGHGISTGSGCTISGCTVRSNALDGINVTGGCVVLNNTCALNGNGATSGAGIHALTTDNRIEGNNCTGADFGIDVDGSGNIIIRNTCSGNTTGNWEIVVNNVYGPIMDRTAPASAAVAAGVNSAASTLATADPNANFSY